MYHAISNDEAVMEEKDGRIAGLLMCSKQEKGLTFLAVHPEYRKRGVAKRLIEFQDDDSKGIPARACYHTCGFVDDEKLTVFAYPCPKMILRL